MEILGFLASALIGISLGLIGGGGSILTVPVLVYLFNVEPVLATAYSLFIVGSTSLVGSFTKYKEGMVNLKTAVIFGIPSILAVYATRAFLVPMIPNPVFSLGSFVVSKAMLLMGLFAVLMVFASVSMIRNKKNGSEEPAQEGPQQFNYP
ncbi:MAG: sulfite exporter TauE/SafE family protein, partial [Saprospiraceae bacterium]|nr:sulfite exporter TauE/SafE family protein [Saprospiraceae bacterium]